MRMDSKWCSGELSMVNGELVRALARGTKSKSKEIRVPEPLKGAILIAPGFNPGNKESTK